MCGNLVISRTDNAKSSNPCEIFAISRTEDCRPSYFHDESIPPPGLKMAKSGPEEGGTNPPGPKTTKSGPEEGGTNPPGPKTAESGPEGRKTLSPGLKSEETGLGGRPSYIQGIVTGV